MARKNGFSLHFVKEISPLSRQAIASEPMQRANRRPINLQ
jgi:hypothetical protein